MDPKQLSYPLYSQIVLVKSNVKGGRLAPMVTVAEITPGFSRLLAILGAFHICSKETSKSGVTFPVPFLKSQLWVVLYSLIFASGLQKFSET